MTLFIASLLGAGAIHFAMAPAHADWWPMAALFAVAGWAQCGLGLALASRPASARVLRAVMIVSGAALVTWAASRSVGLPFGPHAGEPETVGAIDLVAAGFEAVTLVGAATLLRRSEGARPMAWRRWPAMVGGGAVALLTVAALATPSASSHAHGDEEAAHAHGPAGADDGHDHATGTGSDSASDSDATTAGHHDHPDPTATATQAEGHEHGSGSDVGPGLGSGIAGHDHGTDTAAGDDHDTGTAAGADTAADTETGNQDHDHDHDAGTVPAANGTGEVHSHGPCTDPVTAEQQAAADRLTTATRAELPRWADFETARAEGWVPITPEGTPIVHYGRPAWITDGAILDPARPESIMYAFPKRGEPILLGAMYLMEDMTPGPQIGGCLTQWHKHTNLCLSDTTGGMVAVVDGDGRCPPGSTNRPTQDMLHVWGIDLPSGPFAETNPQEIRAALVAMHRR